MNPFTDQKIFIKTYKETLEKRYATPFETSSIRQRYQTLSQMLFATISEQWLKTKEEVLNAQPKQVIYFSMEFLIGRLINNNLANLSLREFVEKALASMDIDLLELENIEVDAGLGTGGLGRLGACFLDSLACLNLIGHGNGIRYRYGLFEQKIRHGYQIEKPDDWLKDIYPWEVRIEEEAVEVPFGGTLSQKNNVLQHQPDEYIRAVPYDIPIVGSRGVVNTLRLWNAEPSMHHIPDKNAFDYDTEIREISGFLYPDDTTDQGKILRIKQQYFFSSAGIQSVLKKHYQTYQTFDNLSEQYAFQINDTHPTLIIPEMIRVMMDDYQMSFDAAWQITKHTAAYTNHTLLAEALEKWPVYLLQPALPRIYKIIETIDRRQREMLAEKLPNKIEKLAIIIDGQIHMAHLAIAGSFSVNGVAKLHSQIIQTQEMRDFHELYPGKFNNKTNGITHRRWLKHINPKLAQMLDTVSDDWLENPQSMDKLLAKAEDSTYQKNLTAIKHEHKVALAEKIAKHQGVNIDPSSIYDVQVKRLHEYKRQLMNALHIMILHHRLTHDETYRSTVTPRTFIFGAKAAATYYYAKKIIKLINSIAEKMNNDPLTKDYLKVVFVENYNVSYAEAIMPAADVSEQISTVTKEASGTGNMKLMMNGAITIGTLDGANVEIAERVGEDNIVIFGMDSDAYNHHKHHQDYHPQEIYNAHEDIRRAIDQLTNGFFSEVDPNEFTEIRDKLLHKDEYYILKDLPDYIKAHEKVHKLYQNPSAWWKTALINIAQSGYFSSDRTIEQYAQEIWKIHPLK